MHHQHHTTDTLDTKVPRRFHKNNDYVAEVLDLLHP